MTENLRRTELYGWHVEAGGRMVPFAGWEMPVQYPTGPIEEHHTTRNAAGLFDIDHMGQMTITGPDAERFANYLFTYDVDSMKPLEAHYSLMCYRDGGIVDDVFIYKLEGRLFIAINASNRHKDVQWAKAHAGSYDVQVRDISDETYMLALQGPKAVAILQKLTKTDLSGVPRFTAAEGEVMGIPTVMGRTGYTGEDGFELFFPAEKALDVWTGILEAGKQEGIKPIGLAARDSLRFEPCMPLYGHEISAEISPFEAGLGFAVSLEVPFIGRDALLKEKLEGPQVKSTAFEMTEKAVPRAEYEVVVDDMIIGEVTTGMFSPTLEKYVGLALVNEEYAKVGTELEIIIRGKPKKAVVVKKPFYVPAYRK